MTGRGAGAASTGGGAGVGACSTAAGIGFVTLTAEAGAGGAGRGWGPYQVAGGSIRVRRAGWVSGREICRKYSKLAGRFALAYMRLMVFCRKWR